MSSSQSPRAKRTSTNDAPAFAKGTPQLSRRATGRVAPENRGAEQLKSNLAIESVNGRGKAAQQVKERLTSSRGFV
jgi:hypothetical protein